MNMDALATNSSHHIQQAKLRDSSIQRPGQQQYSAHLATPQHHHHHLQLGGGTWTTTTNASSNRSSFTSEDAGFGRGGARSSATTSRSGSGSASDASLHSHGHQHHNYHPRYGGGYEGPERGAAAFNKFMSIVQEQEAAAASDLPLGSAGGYMPAFLLEDARSGYDTPARSNTWTAEQDKNKASFDSLSPFPAMSSPQQYAFNAPDSGDGRHEAALPWGSTDRNSAERSKQDAHREFLRAATLDSFASVPAQARTSLAQPHQSSHEPGFGSSMNATSYQTRNAPPATDLPLRDWNSHPQLPAALQALREQSSSFSSRPVGSDLPRGPQYDLSLSLAAEGDAGIPLSQSPEQQISSHPTSADLIGSPYSALLSAHQRKAGTPLGPSRLSAQQGQSARFPPQPRQTFPASAFYDSGIHADDHRRSLGPYAAGVSHGSVDPRTPSAGGSSTHTSFSESLAGTPNEMGRGPTGGAASNVSGRQSPAYFPVQPSHGFPSTVKKGMTISEMPFDYDQRSRSDSTPQQPQRQHSDSDSFARAVYDNPSAQFNSLVSSSPLSYSDIDPLKPWNQGRERDSHDASYHSSATVVPGATSSIHQASPSTSSYFAALHSSSPASSDPRQLPRNASPQSSSPAGGAAPYRSSSGLAPASSAAPGGPLPAARHTLLSDALVPGRLRSRSLMGNQRHNTFAMVPGATASSGASSPMPASDPVPGFGSAEPRERPRSGTSVSGSHPSEPMLPPHEFIPRPYGMSSPRDLQQRFPDDNGWSHIKQRALEGLTAVPPGLGVDLGTRTNSPAPSSSSRSTVPAAPPGQPGPAPHNAKREKYKTELCRQWEETGSCRYGAKCQFAHGAHELRHVDRHRLYKTQICRTYFLTGSCPYARRCCFVHMTPAMQAGVGPEEGEGITKQPLLARLGGGGAKPQHLSSSSSTFDSPATSPTLPSSGGGRMRSSSNTYNADVAVSRLHEALSNARISPGEAPQASPEARQRSSNEFIPRSRRGT